MPGLTACWHRLPVGTATGAAEKKRVPRDKLWGTLSMLNLQCYFFSHWSNQSMKLRCQRRLFCGRSTQWVSSGK